MNSPAYERNGQPIDAAAFYAIACDPRRHVAVEACAGAGKTWMLVSRILRALLDSALSAPDSPLRPQEILAITFTKKAAAEMRERLDSWLKDFHNADDATLGQALAARGISSIDSMGSQNNGEANKNQRQALSNLYRRVLDSGRSVQIRTFHSWFAALLGTAPVAVLQRLGLPLAYELLEDDAPARAQVWRYFYAAVAEDAALHADFAALVLAHGRSQAVKALQAALDKRTEFLRADARGVVDASVPPFGVPFPDFAGLAAPEDLLWQPEQQALLWAAARALGQARAPTFAAKGAELESALSTQNIPGIFAALLTATGTARKFGEKIIGVATLRQAQEWVLQVAQAQQQQQAWLHQQRMARLSRALISQFSQLKRERGWVDMNDLELAAQVLLCDPVLSGWVQERLDARIRHVLIDEFQDTNPLQWQALSSWLSSYADAGQGPSIFIVGDPKQSIYRFRRAEPQVFRAAQDFVQQLGGDLLSCDHTRRNATAVLATVNAVMTQARDADGYSGFRTHSTAAEDTGSVGRLPPIARLHDLHDAVAETGMPAESSTWRNSLTTPRELPEDSLRQREAAQAAAWLAQHLAATPGLQPADIMVLARKRAGLLPMQEALRALQIPAQMGEKTQLMACCEVQDLVALLDVLVSPLHDLSLARAMRSPLFNVSDDSLVQLAQLKQQYPVHWFELLQKTEHLDQEIRGVGAILLRWKSWLDRLPPHDALQAIYDDGDVLARFAAAAPAVQRAAVLSNLRALLGLSLDLEGGRYATPYGLVRALKAGGAQAPAAVNPLAVRLLTVHGAKGLEADTVLLLDTDTAERRADSMGVLIDWPGESAAPQQLVFLGSESRPPPSVAATLAQEQAAQAREELNALYVALTRARHTLVLSSITPHHSNSASWWQRVQPFVLPLLPPLLPPQAVTAADAPPTPDTFDLPSLSDLPGFLPAKTASLEQLQLQLDDPNDLQARIGQAMHRLLEWGGNLSAVALDRVAREYGLHAEQAQAASVLAANILAGQGAWAWQDPVLAWQGNEVELVYQGQTLRLDRLVQRQDSGHAGHWWVLDYKSAASPQQQPQLRAQLQTYRQAVQAAYPGQVVKAAFLTGQGAVVELL